MSVPQIVVDGPGVVRQVEVDDPIASPSDVIVDVAACGLCGSDASYIKMGGLLGPGNPMRLGHEFSGYVSEIGADVKDVNIGDHVVVHPGDEGDGRIGNGGPEGALTTRVVVKNAASGGRLFKVPSEMSPQIAALCEPLGVGMHAVERVEVDKTSRVAVFGCGPIGLAAIATCKDIGVESVVGIDLSPSRRDLATQLGADAVFDGAQDPWELLRQEHGEIPHMFGPTCGSDVFIEATGVAEVLQAMIANAKVGASISVVGLHYSDVPTSFLTILMKELDIFGSMEYPERFDAALELLERRDLSALITHETTLGDISDAVERLSDADEGKIMVNIGTEALRPISQ